MELEEFKKSVLRTWNTEGDTEERLFNATLGIVGELGEVAEPIKKTLYHGKTYDTDKYLKEVGDVLYYLVAYFEECEDANFFPEFKLENLIYPNEVRKPTLHTPLQVIVSYVLYKAHRVSPFEGTYEEFISEAMRLNKAKLEERYPDGFCKAISSVKPDEKH